jgi:DNA-binding ferritin-like protein
MTMRLSMALFEESVMCPAESHDPIAALNQVLSEVIDVVQDVKQAHRKVPETDALHAVLDQIFGDLATWAGLLVERDEALGVAPLEMMPSVAGRRPPNLWPGRAPDEEVRRVVGEHLERLAQHVSAALAEQEDEGARAILVDMQRGLLAHMKALAEP